MVLSKEPGWEDQQLARYLLGELSDEDADRIDERSIADEELTWRLREVEDELVDAYVTGRLAGEQLQRFTWFYLSSERRRDRVRFAEALHRAVDGDRPRVVAFSRWRRLYDFSLPLAWGIGLAAALMLVGCGALLQQDVNLRQALHSLQAESAVLERRTQDLLRQLADQRSEAARAAQDLERARASLADAMDRAGSVPARAMLRTTSVSTLQPVSLLLLPQARAAGTLATLTLPRATTQVALQLQLEFDDFRGYRVAIEDAGRARVIWRSDRIPARTARGTSTLPVMVPANVLTREHYAVELFGISAAGKSEVIGSYSFRVQRP
jgi:hypothetical protein